MADERLGMGGEIRQQISAAWSAIPEEFKSGPASESELVEFEQTYGELPALLRWFLLECGGGPVGIDYLDGISELGDSQVKFDQEAKVSNGWTLKGVLVLGWDGAGNPIALERETGRVLTEDHNFGGVHELAPSYRSLLETRLLKRQG